MTVMALSVMFGGWRARMHGATACTLPRGALGRRLFSHARPSVRKLLRARPLVVHARNPGDFGGVPDELPSFGDEDEDTMDDMGGEQDVPDESLDLDEDEIEAILAEGAVTDSGAYDEDEEELTASLRGVRGLSEEDDDLAALDSLIAAVQNGEELEEEEEEEEEIDELSESEDAGEVMRSRLAAAGAAGAAAAAAAVIPLAGAAAASAAGAAAGSSGSGSGSGSGETAGSGPAAGGGDEVEEEEEEPIPYPPLPSRSYLLPELLKMVGLPDIAATAPAIEISDLVTCNSKSAGPGALYICVPSNDTDDDGHDWVAEAAELGISAVLADRPVEDAPEGLPVVMVPNCLELLGQLASAFYEHPSRRMRTIGLVGSYGKTTSSWLMRGMFEEAEEVVGMVGTLEYAIQEHQLTAEGDIWDFKEMRRRDPTWNRERSAPFHATPYPAEFKYEFPGPMPDALQLQKTLSHIADRGGSTTLIECDVAELRDGRCDDVDLDVLVYTNLYQGTAEGQPGGEAGQLAAVNSLFSRLTDPERHRAVVNVDDRYGRDLASRVEARDIPVVTYAVSDRDADVYAERVKYTIWEVEVLVRTPLGRLQIIVPMLGKSNVYNILASVAVGIACGVPLKSIVAGIEAVEIVPGRSEIVDAGQSFSVVVDFARNPDQLATLLDGVHEATKRTLLVMGCPGHTSKEHRAAMGFVANAKSEVVFLTNDSPGTSFPDRIIADVVAGFPDEVRSMFADEEWETFRDRHRVPPYLHTYLDMQQSYFQRYVVEDRASAIRMAIGMARKGDVVLVVGRGHEDFMDYWDGEAEKVQYEGEEETLEMEGTIRGWFDDRKECLDALSNLGKLESIPGLVRDYFPWTRWPETDYFTLQQFLVLKQVQNAVDEVQDPRERLARMVREEGDEDDEDDEDDELEEADWEESGMAAP